MPDIAITRLVEAFSKFERRRFELAGHALLDSALSMARDILLDDRRVDLHAEVHSLVSVWFDRVCNWRDLLTARTPPSYDSVKLYAENISLFDDAVFELPQKKFDREGVRKVSDLVKFKPKKLWTASERRMWDEFVKRVRG